MQITTQKSILIGSVIIAVAIVFRADVSALIITEAKAEIADMDYFDLRTDRDFKKAVKYIVENCSVSGYVEDGYLYSADISC